MIAIHPIEAPIRIDQDDALRVGNTRVLLDLVVEAYEEGATPEEIVIQYDALTLADVYGAISYYLNHRDEILSYLAERQRQADELRKRFDRNDYAEIRNRLLERQARRRTSSDI